MTAGRTARLKRDFLAHFSLTGNITAACRVVGIDRRRVYDWQENDSRFLHDFRQAEIQSTERLEEEAYRRAHDGVVKETPIMHNGQVVSTIVETKYSDTLLIFLLKARNPAKYRDNVHVTLDDKRQAQQLAEKLAADLALPIEDVMAELESILKART
jgi:hypothetical protein